MRRSFDQINISDAAVSVCEMRAITSQDSGASTGVGPRLAFAESRGRSSQNQCSAFIIHPAAAASSPARPITAGLPRPLSASFDAALVGFDVSIDTEEPRTEP